MTYEANNKPKNFNQKRTYNNYNNNNYNNNYQNKKAPRKYYNAPQITPETKARNKKIIEKVEEWQAFKFIKHLVCGEPGCGVALVAKEINGRVVLQCPKCKTIQSYIPKSVLKTKFYLTETLLKLRSLYEWVVS